MSEQKSYRNLNDLICGNANAKDFYLRQPEDVQGRMQQNTQAIRTEAEMRRCAQNVRNDE